MPPFPPMAKYVTVVIELEDWQGSGFGPTVRKRRQYSSDRLEAMYNAETVFDDVVCLLNSCEYIERGV